MLNFAITPTGAQGGIRRAVQLRLPRSLADIDLVVDLAAEPLGLRWCRGAATLALLCAGAIALAPGFDRPWVSAEQSVHTDQRFHLNPMLSPGDAAEAAPLTPLPRVTPDQPAKPVIAATDSEIRIQGEVSEGLYWSLRDAGVSPKLAAEYLAALASRIDVGADVAPFDRFDLVVSRDDAGRPASLLLAAVHRFQGDDVQLLKWNVGGKTEWFDGDAGKRRADGLMAPVAGRMTSGFGMRRHPILRFARMHSGIDFGARYGTPIVAAADGEIAGAGWAGGYGRQVQVRHEGGVVTTYSHMSGIAAQPGQPVRQGEVIGYVGSTGISTGPHLHFEVRVGGRAVDPLSVKLRQSAQISGEQLKAFKARLKELLSIGAKRPV